MKKLWHFIIGGVAYKALKEQCHEIFNHFFGLKDSIWAPYEQAKIVFLIFFVSAKILDCKTRKLPVRVVNDYANMQIFL